MAEITLNDEFGRNISKTIKTFKYVNNLELGSWDGNGSTLCFIDGMELFKDKDKSLQCVEIDPERFELLKNNMSKYNYVSCYNESSIGLDYFLPKSFDEIWDSKYNKITLYSKDLVKSWYDFDLPRIPKFGFLDSSKRRINYDAVLIDGSEFTGYSEFVLLKNSTKCFMLDDVFTAYKCNQVYHELKQDVKWELLFENRELRNGYAIFKLR